MERLIFATLVASSGFADGALLLLESLRTFGGGLANKPCIVMVPKTAEPLSNEVNNRLSVLNARLVPFDLDEPAGQFPFASMVSALSKAEEETKGKTEVLVWMNTDTLVVNPPTVFLLPKKTNYAYRPVHHTLIGSIYEKPLDSFWSLIYQHCRVTEDKVFPMETCVKDNTLRPYFNAGLFVGRPEQGLLTEWRDRFEQLYRHPDFNPFYEKDVRYKIFMHQAVLAGVVLNMFRQEELEELPEVVNYPLHLHHQYPLERRPKTLNDLTTCRYENIKELLKSLEGITVREPLESWLKEKLEKTNNP
jgi:hypothetical protein